jgi:uncharacterized membrane protein
MWKIVQPYTGWELDIEFLLTKQHVIHLNYYKTSFYLHIFSSLIVLLSGALLFLPIVLRKAPSIHRIAGRIYVILVLLISAPSGLIMAFHSNGNFSTTINFILLSVFWWVFTFIGFVAIIKGQVIKHKQWMTRSFALTMSAITLRLAQMILNTFWAIDPDIQYCIVSWGSWIINLFIAEIIIRTTKFNRMKSINFNFFIPPTHQN